MSQILFVLPILLDLVNSNSYLNLHNLKFVLKDHLFRHWNYANFPTYWNYSERICRSRVDREKGDKEFFLGTKLAKMLTFFFHTNVLEMIDIFLHGYFVRAMQFYC